MIIELCISCSYTLVVFFVIDISQTVNDKVQWVIIGFVILGFMTNLSFIIYYGIKDIIIRVRESRKGAKVGTEPEFKNSNNSIMKLSQSSVTETSIYKIDEVFYGKLRKRSNRHNP